MRIPAALALALLMTPAALAQSNAFKIGMIYDAGGKMDRGFNQSAYEGSQRANRELSTSSTDYEPRPGAEQNLRTQIAAQISNWAKDGYKFVVGVGYANNQNITDAAKANPKMYFALVDDLSPQTSNVASLLFKEEEGSYLAGVVAAKSSSTGIIGFVGGQDGPLLWRFAAGFKAGVKAVNPNYKVFSKYVGGPNDPNAWSNPTVAYKQAGQLRAMGADVIYAAAGNSGNGVISYVKDAQCVRASQLPAGVKFISDNFKAVPKSASYKANCAGNTRPMFFIGVDANQNYLGDTDGNPKTLNHGLTSMLKRVDNAVYAIVESIQASEFKGGEWRFGLREGGVGVAIDNYNRVLISPELERTINVTKTNIIRGKISVPVK